MKAVITLLALIGFSGLAFAQTTIEIPANAIPVIQDVVGNYQKAVIEAGIAVEVRGDNATVYVRSGASVIVVSGDNAIIYYEEGATIGPLTGLNGMVKKVIFSKISAPADEVTVIPAGEDVSKWLYFGPWPWVYIVDSGWAFLDPRDEGLWIFPTFEGNIILLEAYVE